MKNIKNYLIALPIAILALCPGSFFNRIQYPLLNPAIWICIVLFSGFLGAMFLFTKEHFLLKALIVYLFIGCFFSTAPFISFSSYIGVILCAYFYLACLKIDDWSFMIKVIHSLVLINIILLVMQYIGKDTLLNFGRADPGMIGTIGNPMKVKSLFIILFAFAITYKKKELSALTRKGLMILGPMFILLICVYVIQHRVLVYFFPIRFQAWLHALKLVFQHPFIGWGMGTFKIIFHTFYPYAPSPQWRAEGMWMQAHNDWVQMIFEIGGRIYFVRRVDYMAYKKCKKQILCHRTFNSSVGYVGTFPDENDKYCITCDTLFSVL